LLGEAQTENPIIYTATYWTYKIRHKYRYDFFVEKGIVHLKKNPVTIYSTFLKRRYCFVFVHTMKVSEVQ